MIAHCLYVPSSTLVRKLKAPDVYVGMLVAAGPIERQEILHARALADSADESYNPMQCSSLVFEDILYRPTQYPTFSILHLAQ